MKHTIDFLSYEAQNGNQEALKALMFNSNADIIEKERYTVIIDKDNTSNLIKEN